MRVLQINGGVFGSTGNIMFGIAKKTEEKGIEVLCASPVTTTNRYKEPDRSYVKIGSFFTRRISVLLGRISGFQGCFSYFATKKLIRVIKKFKPDVIQLHTLHGDYVNLPMLFSYIKKNKIKVVWTLHDCWAFTGHCPHFEAEKCEKWKTQCRNCARYKDYPKSLYDNSAKMFRLKRKWFTSVENMTIVTPSRWLADCVKQSFLKDYPIEVINNGIDLDVFKPSESDFRIKYNCEDKFILLGVSFGWNEKKGLDIFCELAERLSGEYQIVLVGTDDMTDKILPENIISIHRTQNQKKLAEIYSAADVLVNPTRADTFPTVNMESLACGTPVLTFKAGGSPEVVDDSCGAVVPCGDVEALVKEIECINLMKPYPEQSCTQKAKRFNVDTANENYLRLYKKLYS